MTPPVRELGERLSVSRETVRRVLRKLERDGVVIVRGGWGTFRR